MDQDIHPGTVHEEEWENAEKRWRESDVGVAPLSK